MIPPPFSVPYCHPYIQYVAVVVYRLLVHLLTFAGGIVSISCIPNIDFLLSKCGEQRAGQPDESESTAQQATTTCSPPTSLLLPLLRNVTHPLLLSVSQSPPCLKGGRSRFLWENPAWGGKPPFKIGGRDIGVGT